jgi:hypothetical protein
MLSLLLICLSYREGFLVRIERLSRYDLLLVELLLAREVGAGLDEGGIGGLNSVGFGVQICDLVIEVVRGICQIEAFAERQTLKAPEPSLAP